MGYRLVVLFLLTTFNWHLKCYINERIWRGIQKSLWTERKFAMCIKVNRWIGNQIFIITLINILLLNLVLAKLMYDKYMGQFCELNIRLTGLGCFSTNEWLQNLNFQCFYSFINLLITWDSLLLVHCLLLICSCKTWPTVDYYFIITKL